MDAPREIAEIEANQIYQRRMWWVERAGWAGMAALVLGGLLGVFGGTGPLATGRHEAEGIVAEWPRMARLGSTEPVRLTVPDGVAELRLGPGFAAEWRLRDTTPPGIVGAGTAGASSVTLHIEPVGSPGPRRLRLDVAGQRLDLPVFVWH